MPLPAYLVEATSSFADHSNIKPLAEIAPAILARLGQPAPTAHNLRLWASEGRRGFPLPTLVLNGTLHTTEAMLEAWLYVVAPPAVTRDQVAARKQVQRDLIAGVIALQPLNGIVEQAVGVSSLKDAAAQKWAAIEAATEAAPCGATN